MNLGRLGTLNASRVFTRPWPLPPSEVVVPEPDPPPPELDLDVELGVFKVIKHPSGATTSFDDSGDPYTHPAGAGLLVLFSGRPQSGGAQTVAATWGGAAIAPVENSSTAGMGANDNFIAAGFMESAQAGALGFEITFNVAQSDVVCYLIPVYRANPGDAIGGVGEAIEVSSSGTDLAVSATVEAVDSLMVAVAGISFGTAYAWPVGWDERADEKSDSGTSTSTLTLSIATKLSTETGNLSVTPSAANADDGRSALLIELKKFTGDAGVPDPPDPTDPPEESEIVTGGWTMHAWAAAEAALPALSENKTATTGNIATQLSGLVAGDRLGLDAGTYTGNRTISADGSEGSPIMVDCRDAVITGVWTISGDWIVIYGGDWSNGRIVVTGASPRITGAEFHGWSGDDSYAIEQTGGAGLIVDRCEFYGWGGGGSSDSSRAIVCYVPNGEPVLYRCHFHDPLAGADNGREAVQFGQQPSHSNNSLKGLILFCLFDTVAQETEVISFKSSDNQIVGSTFKNCNNPRSAYLSLRHGERNVAAANYLTGCKGIHVLDADHILVGNVCAGGAAIYIESGTVTAAATPSDSPPAATRVTLSGNAGNVSLGHYNRAVAATDTRIETHTGTITTVKATGTSPASGSHPTATYTIALAAAELTVADVGPSWAYPA